MKAVSVKSLSYYEKHFEIFDNINIFSNMEKNEVFYKASTQIKRKGKSYSFGLKGLQKMAFGYRTQHCKQPLSAKGVIHLLQTKIITHCCCLSFIFVINQCSLLFPRLDNVCGFHYAVYCSNWHDY